MCVAHPSSACGTTGQCASGACAYWAQGTKCLGPTPDQCNSDGVTLNTWQCDGRTSCVGAKQTCEPYKCLPGANPGADAVCASGACRLPIAGGCSDLSLCAPNAQCCIPLQGCGKSYCSVSPCPL
jgi:hypothetical protein